MKISDIKKVVPMLLEAGQVPCLVGHAGDGKTTVVEQIAKSMNGDIVTWRLGQTSDVGDIKGMPNLNENKQVTEFFPPAHLPKDGKGIIFLDEINRSHEDIIQCMFEFVERGRFESYKKPEGWGIVAACNPATAEYLTNKAFQEKALLDRMVFITFEPTPQEWLEYAKEAGFAPTTIAYYTENPQDLDGDREDINLNFIEPSRRSAERLSILDGLYEQVGHGVFTELAMGIIGPERGVKYARFKQESEKTWKPSEILNQFDKLKSTVSEKANHRTDLVHRTNNDLISYLETTTKLSDQQVDNLIEYIKTLPSDLAGGLFWKIVIDHPSAIQDTKLTNDEKLADELISITNIHIQKVVDAD